MLGPANDLSLLCDGVSPFHTELGTWSDAICVHGLICEMCVQDVQSEYDTYKKGKTREITDLKKDSQRQESKMRRLAMLNQKQKSVLQVCPTA